LCVWRPDGTGEYVPAHVVLVKHGMCIKDCIEYKKRVYET
jgi:hypothetical protein